MTTPTLERPKPEADHEHEPEVWDALLVWADAGLAEE